MKKFSLLTLGLLALCTISTMAQSYQSKMERYGGLITEGRFLEACQLFTDTDSVSPFIKLHKQILAVAALMNCNAKLEQIRDIIHIHPTLGEILQDALI